MCVGLFGCVFELRRAGKHLHPGEEMDEVKHVDRLAIVRLSPWPETGNERLNAFPRQWYLFDDRQVLVDLRLSQLARALRMPDPERHVQDHQRSGKSEVKPHLCFLPELVLVCRSEPCC